MSRYLVDKFIYQVDRSEELLQDYIRSPAELVARWEKDCAHKVTEIEETSAHHFTDEERSALAERDFEKLYAMGANSFLLWTLMLPILEKDFPDFRAVAAHYREKIRTYGRPDFST